MAGRAPVRFGAGIVPEPVILNPLRSKFPPSCGVVSSSRLLIPPPPPPDAVIVTIPAEIAVTSKFVPKLIVPAVPTTEPSCCTTTPEPDAVIPVNPEPSPEKDVAVHTP